MASEACAGIPPPTGAMHVDCGNGTVTDNRTGLAWLQNADCFEPLVDWPTAMDGLLAGEPEAPADRPGSTEVEDLHLGVAERTKERIDLVG